MKKTIASQQIIIDQQAEQLGRLAHHIRVLEGDADIVRRVRRAAMSAAKEEAKKLGRVTLVATRH